MTAASCATYLYIHIAKGNDFAKARIVGIKSEIEVYCAARHISGAVATWRMLGCESHSRYPSVTRIHAQLQGGTINSVLCHAHASAGERTVIALHVASDLMRYLKRHTAARFSRLTLFTYFETYIVTEKQNDPNPTSAPAGQWLGQYGKIVTVKTTDHVRRIHFKSPAVGDPF